MQQFATMTVEQFHAGYAPRRVGKRMILLAETSSTNSVALDAAVSGDSDGLVVLADYQTAGRGRKGRTWLAPRGASVLCSVLLLTPSSQPSDDEAFGGRLTLLAAVAVCDAVRRATEITPAIKWPNDIRVDGRKLGGILIESRPIASGRAWVVGVGLNCLQHAGHFPPELVDIATSLEIVASHGVSRVAVARELVRSFDHWLTDDAEDLDRRIHETWTAYAEPLGQRVRIAHQGREYTGRTLAVEPTGGLVVQTDDGRREWFDPMLTTLL